MNFLENELVQRYFRHRYDACGGMACPCDGETMAWNVLAAMQEPIKKGEKCLIFTGSGNIYEEIEVSGEYESGVHPNRLKIPSCFQTPEKKECRAGFLKCMDCGEEIIHKSSTTPDLVEEKIEAIKNTYGCNLETPLQQLVALARSTKDKK